MPAPISWLQFVMFLGYISIEDWQKNNTFATDDADLQFIGCLLLLLTSPILAANSVSNLSNFPDSFVLIKLSNLDICAPPPHSDKADS